MNGTSTEPSLSDLLGRLGDARAHLNALDEADPEYEVNKMAAEHWVETEEDRYETARQVDRHNGALTQMGSANVSNSPMFDSYQRPQSSSATLNVPKGFSPYAGSTMNAFGGHFASDGVSAGQGRIATAPGWGFESTNGDANVSDTAGFQLGGGHPSSGSNSTPDSGYLQRKRPRNSLDLSKNSSGQPNKSLRATPSPAMTGSTTPTSYGSEFPDIPEELFAALGGNPNEDLREMREEQKRQDKLAKEKKEQMLRDEEYALALQNEWNAPSLPTGQPSAGPSSGFGAIQTATDHGDRYSQSIPLSSSPLVARHDSFADPFTSTVPSKQTDYTGAGQASVKKKNAWPSSASPSEGSYGLVSNGPMKKETSYQPSPPRKHAFSDFIDLSSDDDSEFQTFDPIGRSNKGLTKTDPNVWGQSNPQNHPTELASANYNPYSYSGPSGSSNTEGVGPHLGNMLSNVARNVYQTGYNLVDQLGLPPTGFGGSSVYNGSAYQYPENSSNVPIIDLESDPDSPGEMAQALFDRHGYSADDPANRRLYEQYLDRVDYITHDPTRTAADIKNLLENIRPDEDLPPEDREGTPEAMTYPLMEHQKLGLAWMRKMEESEHHRGGILADDMGLGKTIQALALMVSRKSDNPTCKTTLVVAPVALMKQWEREIKSKLRSASNHRLSTYILHGAKRQVEWRKLKTFDVVLTTFGTLATELKRRDAIDMKRRANPNWRPSGKEDNLPLLGDECMWYRVIIDEAQCIKNKNTKAALAACALQAKYRWCVSGTPMQNSTSELYSLIRFLRIEPYNDSNKFSADLTRPLRSQSRSFQAKAMKKLQALLKAILLRRTKKSVIDGKPILDLPERTTHAEHATFTDDENDFYRALENQTQLQFNKYLKAGTVGRNYSNILVLLLRLRQACCHPHLIKDHGQASISSDVSPETMMKLAKELAPEVVARIKEQSESNDDAALECPVCMDMTENSTIFIPCGHNTCSECFARISDPSQAIADGNGVENGAEVKCPNCRGKIMPSKVIDHNAFKKIHMPESNKDTFDEVAEDSQTDIESTDDSESDSDNEDDESEGVDSKGNLNGFVVSDDVVDDETDSEGEDKDYRAGKTPFEKSSKKMKKSKSKGKGKEKAPPRKTLAQLKKESSGSAKARRKYVKRLEKEWIPSAKIEKTMGILRDVQHRKHEETKQPEKTIIFSQFTSLLDLLEVPISREGWGYRRYDGSMSANARNDAVLEFTDKKEVKIMLISLKAGNAGLNLVAASQVIIFDPFWNPYIEEQAIDRAHRIGQLKPVEVHRMLVPNTVEDRILALQEKKRELIESALDETASKSIARLGTRELAFLFDVQT